MTLWRTAGCSICKSCSNQVPLPLNSFKHCCFQLVRLMVSTSLQAVSRLSQLVYDPANRSIRSKGRKQAERSVLEQVLEESPAEQAEQEVRLWATV